MTMLRRLLLHSAACILGMVLVSAPLLAQEKSVRPGINKPFENPDLKDFLKKFEGESREIAAHAKEIVAACKLKPGMAVADVGAGTGLFTRKFPAEVGEKGKVYAVDISPAFLRHIEKTCADGKIKNVETIQCDQFSTKLPKNSVDLVFICDTYHHFEFPQRTLQSIHDALRPGGQIILIDFHRIEGKSGEFVLGHVRAGQEIFVREITSAGFKVIGEEKLLKENYFVRFEKKAEIKEGKLDLHIVPTPIKSYRLLAMSMDDDGFIWAGAIHKVVHRYDPRTGKVEDFPIPFPATASSCICVGKKVYILGQSYPKLIIYDRTAKKFGEVAYPSSKPNVWYGTEAIDGRHIFLFDRGGAGVIKWDTQTDSGKAIPWPYKAPFPGGGRFEAQDKAIWCNVWESGGQYRPLGIARLEVEKNEFTGFHPFPSKDDGLKPFTDPATTLFLPYTLKGKIVPFDFKEKRWCKFLDVPQYGKLFGFMGGPIPHKGCYYFSLSTYNGTDTGCDGKPYHFCNAILEFDPHTRRFEFPTLEAKDAYHQVAYMLSAKGEFFATGSNIREKDGKLNRDRAGEVVFWQTMKPTPMKESVKNSEMPWIVVSKDKKGFALEPSKRPFTPWGFNYDHDTEGRLVEDYWEKEWDKLESHFAQMKKLGANVVRIHLQLGKFMDGPEKSNEKALERLVKLIRLAEKERLYLDLTGLGCYHKADVPPWYDKLTERKRWDVQARFWRAIAGRCADSPAVFCYDLMNEPVVPGGKGKDWLGPPFGGKHFVQFITLDQQNRSRPDIARQWVRHLTTAVREKDKRHLITVGLVDWSLDRPGLTSGFVPAKIAADLDFVSVHLYPKSGKLNEALDTLAGFAVGKPVVIEETFPLACTPKELEEFIEGSKKHTTGWIGFYWGKTPEELRRSKTIPDALTLGWLELFEKKAKK